MCASRWQRQLMRDFVGALRRLVHRTQLAAARFGLGPQRTSPGGKHAGRVTCTLRTCQRVPARAGSHHPPEGGVTCCGAAITLSSLRRLVLGEAAAPAMKQRIHCVDAAQAGRDRSGNPSHRRGDTPSCSSVLRPSPPAPHPSRPAKRRSGARLAHRPPPSGVVYATPTCTIKNWFGSLFAARFIRNFAQRIPAGCFSRLALGPGSPRHTEHASSMAQPDALTCLHPTHLAAPQPGQCRRARFPRVLVAHLGADADFDPLPALQTKLTEIS